MPFKSETSQADFVRVNKKATKSLVDDMIEDLYSEDDNTLKQDEDYSSPEKVVTAPAAERLGPVIEDSQEYSVTPSRVIQTASVSKVFSPQRGNK